MILNIFFTDLFCIAEQVYINVHRFSKHKGDPGINSGLPTLTNSTGKLGENILIVRSVYNSCLCHGPVPVVKKTFFLRIYTYLLIGSCFCSLNSFHRNVIIPVFIIDILHLDGAEF